MPLRNSYRLPNPLLEPERTVKVRTLCIGILVLHLVLALLFAVIHVLFGVSADLLLFQAYGQILYWTAILTLSVLNTEVMQK